MMQGFVSLIGDRCVRKLEKDWHGIHRESDYGKAFRERHLLRHEDPAISVRHVPNVELAEHKLNSDTKVDTASVQIHNPSLLSGMRSIFGGEIDTRIPRP